MTRDLMYRREIQEMVRDVYEHVEEPTVSAADRLYDDHQLAQIPDVARRWALGVGNPVRHADLTEGEEVVDLGCGAGVDTLLAASRVAPGGTVTGVDFLDAMIRRGRRNAEISGCDNVTFVEAEIDRLPLDDASVDVVISNGTINLAARKSRVFAEAKRVLRPGGRLSVSDLTIKEEELPSEILVHPSAWAG